jgi:hypothetical protein
MNPSVTVTPARYVTIELASTLTGYTKRAIEAKIARGDWMENDVWVRAADARILIDLRGYERWVERQRTAA